MQDCSIERVFHLDFCEESSHRSSVESLVGESVPILPLTPSIAQIRTFYEYAFINYLLYVCGVFYTDIF